MNAHTPGPWMAQGNRVMAAGEQIGFINANPSCCTAEDWANARLIAAAPDLLAALQNARNVLAGIASGDLKTVSADGPALAQCRAAIAKATGEQA